MFQFPDNLHPNCAPVAWLLGTWGGSGHGDYPTIEPYQYGQEIVFQQDGRSFFHYFARSWVIDEDGETLRQDAQETGFLRCHEDNKLELVLAHASGHAEIWYGMGAAGKVEFHTAGVSFTETAEEVVAGHRIYGQVEGDLLYAYDMEAQGHDLQPRTWARLQRQ